MGSRFRFDPLLARTLPWLGLLPLLASASCKFDTRPSGLTPVGGATDSRQTGGTAAQAPATDAQPQADAGRKPDTAVPDSGIQVIPQAAQDAGTSPPTPPGPPYHAADSGMPPDATTPPPLPEMTMQPDAGLDAGKQPALIRLAVTDSAVKQLPSQTSSTFSVSETRDLYFHSVWENLAGGHRELRRFYAPSGSLYYEKLLPFSTLIEAPVPFKEVVLIPHSKQIAALSPDEAGQLLVSDAFPLAGTWISDRALVGTWRLEVYLDAATQPNGTLNFELTP